MALIDNLDSNKDDTTQRLLSFITKAIVALFLFVVIAPLIFGYWLRQQYPVVASISIENIQVIGPTALCAGDKLTIAFDFHTQGSGVLIRDNTVRRVEPPKTIIFSNSRSWILEGPTDEHVIEGWHVPHSYNDPELDESIPIRPGEYVRNIAIRSAGRDDVTAIESVPFTIKEDCE